MTYASVQDVQDRVPERLLMQVTGASGGVLDEDTIAAALSDAADTIDSYLAVLPAAERPEGALLKPYAVDIALYALARGRPGEEFEALRNRYQDAVAYLKWLARERFPGGGRSESPTGGDIRHSAPDRVMTDETLEGYR